MNASAEAARAVAELPSRVAHVTHALLAAWGGSAGSAPVTAAEVCVYDSEALSVASTAAALREARRRGLVDGIGGVWFATGSAHALRDALEDRFLAEVADD